MGVWADGALRGLLGHGARLVEEGALAERVLLLCATAQAAEAAGREEPPSPVLPLSLAELALNCLEAEEERPLTLLGLPERVALLARRLGSNPRRGQLRFLGRALRHLDRLRLAGWLPEEALRGRKEPLAKSLRALALWEEELFRERGALGEPAVLLWLSRTLGAAELPAPLQRYRHLAAFGFVGAAPVSRTVLERLAERIAPAVCFEGGLPANLSFWRGSDPNSLLERVGALLAQRLAREPATTVAVALPSLGREGRTLAGALHSSGLPFLCLDGPLALGPAPVRDLLAWLSLLCGHQPGLAASRLLSRPPFALAPRELAEAGRILRERPPREGGGRARTRTTADGPLAAFAGLREELSLALKNVPAERFLALLCASTGLRDSAAAEGSAALEGLRQVELFWQRLGDLRGGSTVERAHHLLRVAQADLLPFAASAPAGEVAVTLHRLDGEPRPAALTVVVAPGKGATTPARRPPSSPWTPPRQPLEGVLRRWLGAARGEALLCYSATDRRGQRRLAGVADRLRLAARGSWRAPPVLAGATAHGGLARHRGRLLAALEQLGRELAEPQLGLDLGLERALAEAARYAKRLAVARSGGGEGKAAEVDRFLQEQLPPSVRAAYAALESEGEPPGEEGLAALLPRHGAGLYLSPSDLASYRACPLRYKLGRLLRIPIAADQHQRFGIAVHQVLERFHRRFVTEPGTAATEEGRRFLFAVLERSWARFGLDQGRPLALAREALARYQRDLQQGEGQPAFLERHFALRLGPHLLQGRIDRIDRLPDGSYELIDYKTSRPWPAERLKEDLQLPLYTLAANRRFQLAVSRVTYYFVIDGVKVSAAAPAEETLSKVIQAVEGLARSIEALQFPAKPSYENCSGCSFLPVCPAVEG